MAKHAMFRADNLAGTTQGKYLASVRMTEDLDNGSIVVPGAYEDGAREVRAAGAPQDSDKVGTIAILGSEEVVKNVTYDTVGDFTNVDGSIARAYILEGADVFSVSAEAFVAVPEVGAAVKVAAGAHKMGVEGDITVGTCVAIENDGATTWYVVRV